MEAGGATHDEPSSFIALLPSMLGELARYAIYARQEERWPLMRLGDRERIPRMVRRLIFERDGGCCLSCGIALTLKTAQLDHIVPWSAGGPDVSTNLRVLCEPCNADRSNFRTGLDDHAAQRPPVAEICIACIDRCGWDDEDGDPPGLVPAYCGWCGIVSRTWPWQLY